MHAGQGTEDAGDNFTQTASVLVVETAFAARRAVASFLTITARVSRVLPVVAIVVVVAAVVYVVL